MRRQLLDVLAMLMVGDGVLTALQPKRHCLLWEIGPEPWQELVEELVQHPTMTRYLGIAEACLGVWLATCQESE